MNTTEAVEQIMNHFTRIVDDKDGQYYQCEWYKCWAYAKERKNIKHTEDCPLFVVAHAPLAPPPQSPASDDNLAEALQAIVALGRQVHSRYYTEDSVALSKAVKIAENALKAKAALEEKV